MRFFFLSLLLTFSFSFAHCEDFKLPKPPKENIYSNYRLCVKASILMFETIHLYSYEELGTAVGIGKRNIICCAHEIEDKNNSYALDIFDDDGVFKKRIDVSVKKVDYPKDLCLLESKEDLPYFVDIDKNTVPVQVGDWTYCIGARLGSVPYAISWGNLVTKSFEKLPAFSATSMIIFKGNSGGSVFDADTNSLVGIISRAYSREAFAYSLYIPIKTIREWLKKPIEEEVEFNEDF